MDTELALKYLQGFAQEFCSEALPGALPIGRNSPQRCPYGLYAEQISGTAFTAPRHLNRRSWTYRIWPSVTSGPFVIFGNERIVGEFTPPVSPDPMRWDPLPIPERPTDFVEGWITWAGTGSALAQQGCGIHLYAANRSMKDRYAYNADGELLIVPQLGPLVLSTEFGRIALAPQEVAVIPRGVRFCVELIEPEARGYICENFGNPFRLPELGPIGSNGLANARDFSTPVACYEDRDVAGELICKFMGQLWRAPIDHSPLDVVAWHGNHVPYKYDLRRFNTMGSVSYDHPDPSIFSVLQAPSDFPGVGAVDFVIFPPRWLAMEQTFRPPWFHRNVASEFMGLIHGRYDAKASGFVPGSASLHNSMCAHGPDAETFERAVNADTSRPARIDDTMAFMFESRTALIPTPLALESPQRQLDYAHCWRGLRRNFSPTAP